MNISTPATTTSMIGAAPLQELHYPAGHGIPNWTTSPPRTLGTLVPQYRASADFAPFVLSERVVGNASGYSSVTDAAAALGELAAADEHPAVGIVAREGQYFGNELWTVTQRPGEPNSRLAGSTISSFTPVLHLGHYHTFGTDYDDVVGLVQGNVYVKAAR